MGQSGWARLEDVGVEQAPGTTLDLRGVERLREQMVSTLRQHGVDPDSGETVDASQVPGLQEAVFGLLAQNGVDLTGFGGGPTGGAGEDPSSRPSGQR